MGVVLAVLVAGVAVPASAQETSAERKRVPRVKSVVPALGAENVDPSLTEIRITFDMSMSRTGYSVVGGGPHFPSPAGPPRWLDAHTFVLPVKLQANRQYHFAVNSPQHRNFRSVWLVPAEPLACHFKTGGMTAIRRDPDAQRKINIESFDALTDALRSKYSYFDVRDVDWEKLFVAHRRDIVNQPTTEGWMRRTARMLAVAGDVHMTLQLDGRQVPTFVRRVEANFNRSSVQELIPDLTQLNNSVAAGKTDDGVAYILITTWSAEAKDDIRRVQEWLEEFSTAPGLIIDVRPNSGGSELLARGVASWFIDRPRVYAKHVYRRGPGPEDFTPVRQRIIEPNDPPRRYTGPVAVLMGPTNLSSCEAFLLMMKQAPRAALVGEPSYGSSGNPAPTFLPNGVKALIPSWKSLTPDGVCIEGRGIAPDIHVAWNGVDPATQDPVLIRALEYLRAAAHTSPANP